MLLETIKSLVIRSKKREDLTVQTQPLPGLVKKSRSKLAATPSDNAHTGAHPGNAQDPNARPLHAEHSAPTSNYFPNARNFVINNNSTTIANIIDSGGIVLQLLAQKRIPGVEVDSSARDPPPKCHPDTRATLRGRIVDWVDGLNRHWRMLWIIGPMGVGKSAIAQTIAEHFNDSGRLCATLFFSRPNHRDDPDGVIPTLAYQLADRYPEYRRIVTQRLAGSVSILEKARRIQFKELIIEPFRILMAEHAQIVREPLLIILDGLDECKSKEAQCEFIELISDHVRQVEEFPLLWMVSSRPEWHLKRLLSHPDFQITCQREEVYIDDAEAQRDVARVLEAGFQDICRKFHDRLDARWPPEADIRRISVTASGHFAFASTIIKFIGDEYRADPRSQLDICIRFLGGSGMPGAMNPLHALDLLYREVLSDVPGDTLPTTMRILGLSIVYPFSGLTGLVQANFLCLDQATFYRSLQHLHSVLDVPPPANIYDDRLHFYHASFADFLSDPLRSGPFSINRKRVHYDAAIHSLKWQKGAIPANVSRDEPTTSRPRLEWIPNGVKGDEIASCLRDYSSGVGWIACCSISDDDVPSIVAELERFDFRDIKSEPFGFAGFLAWLYGLNGRNNSLICVEKAAGPDIQDTNALSITHFTDNPAEYTSMFDLGYNPPHTTIQLQLGRFNYVRSIELTVRPIPDTPWHRPSTPELGPFPEAPLQEPLVDWGPSFGDWGGHAPAMSWSGSDRAAGGEGGSTPGTPWGSGSWASGGERGPSYGSPDEGVLEPDL